MIELQFFLLLRRYGRPNRSSFFRSDGTDTESPFVPSIDGTDTRIAVCSSDPTARTPGSPSVPPIRQCGHSNCSSLLRSDRKDTRTAVHSFDRRVGPSDHSPFLLPTVRTLEPHLIASFRRYGRPNHSSFLLSDRTDLRTTVRYFDPAMRTIGRLFVLWSDGTSPRVAARFFVPTVRTPNRVSSFSC
jgi:hypothetical protein